MDERNVIGGFVMAIMSNLFDFMEPLKWFLLLGFILIMVDLRFGILEAKTRVEVLRKCSEMPAIRSERIILLRGGFPRTY